MMCTNDGHNYMYESQEHVHVLNPMHNTTMFLNSFWFISFSIFLPLLDFSFDSHINYLN